MAFLGLKWGQDWGKRSAHPHQEFSGLPIGKDLTSEENAPKN